MHDIDKTDTQIISEQLEAVHERLSEIRDWLEELVFLTRSPTMAPDDAYRFLRRQKERDADRDKL